MHHLEVVGVQPADVRVLCPERVHAAPERALQLVQATHAPLDRVAEANGVSDEGRVGEQLVAPRAAEREELLDGGTHLKDRQEDLLADRGARSARRHVLPWGADEGLLAGRQYRVFRVGGGGGGRSELDGALAGVRRQHGGCGTAHLHVRLQTAACL